MEFLHYAGGVKLNGIGVAVYAVGNDSVRLQVEAHGKLCHRKTTTISIEVYNALPEPDNPYNSTRRLIAAAELCGIRFL